jgi:molecular chaperone DnaK
MLVGIDLGTTFSAVATIDKTTGRPKIIPNREGEHITPSIIQFTEEGLVFGSEAKDAYDSGEENCVSTFKRSMGQDQVYCTIDGKDYSPEGLSGLLLKHLKEDAEAVAGEKIEEAVITVPAYFYSKQRQATMEAARLAGLKVRKIINEPTAAALAYGLEHWRSNAKILVYDLGGGTFDVTLVAMSSNNELETIATDGDHILGGKDWDARLSGLIAEKIKDESDINPKEDHEMWLSITRQAESLKKRLSRTPELKASLSLPGYGQCNFPLTRTEFDSQTRDLLDKTGSLCENVLRESGLSWHDITDVLLVGGSTRMPQVTEYLEKLTGKKPISHVNPDEAVALGAAIQTKLATASYLSLGTQKPSANKTQQRMLSTSKLVEAEKKITAVGIMKIHDATSHAMGIIAVNEKGDAYVNSEIIPVDYPIPAKCVKPFVFGSAIVRIQYSYDRNGIIHVQARQDDSTQDLPIRTEAVPEDMSKYGRPPTPEKEKNNGELEIFVLEGEKPPLECPPPLHYVVSGIAAGGDMTVYLAVDVSGSMSGQPLEDAQNAMCNFVDNMNMSCTQIGIIAVSDRTDIVLRPCSDANRCTNAIRSITCGQTGYGNEAHPFDEIYSELENVDGSRYAIILADGEWSYQERAIDAAKRCHGVGIDIAAIGFGSANTEFLKAISSKEANAIKVNQSELSQTFGKIAQDIGKDSVKVGKKKLKIPDSYYDTWETEE